MVSALDIHCREMARVRSGSGIKSKHLQFDTTNPFVISVRKRTHFILPIYLLH